MERWGAVVKRRIQDREIAGSTPASTKRSVLEQDILYTLLSTVSTQEYLPLRKHAYSNTLKISPPKTERFQIKILIFFIFLLKT